MVEQDTKQAQVIFILWYLEMAVLPGGGPAGIPVGLGWDMVMGLGIGAVTMGWFCGVGKRVQILCTPSERPYVMCM